MAVPTDVLGISLLIFSLVCLGTWPALLRLSSMQSSDETFSLPPYQTRRGCCAFYRIEKIRNICHVYLDYSLVYFLASCVPLGLTLLVAKDEQEGDRFPPPLLLVAMLGGALLSLGNLSLQWSTTVFGASLTFVLAIQASMTVLLGTGINYLLTPAKTPRPDLLFAGVLAFLLAITLATIAQLAYGRQRRERRDEYTEIEMHTAENASNEVKRSGSNSSTSYTEAPSILESSSFSLTRYGNNGLSLAALGLEEASAATMWVALAVAIAGGLCFGFFSPAFNIAVNDPFSWVQGWNMQRDSTMAVARANMWFSFSFYVTSLLGNFVLLGKQFPTRSLQELATSYILQDSILDRQMAISAGLVCALGNVLQFKGGQLVGYATADLVQAYPLVSTLWDFFLFGEFRHVELCSRLSLLLCLMFAFYSAGVVFLAVSSLGGL